MTLVAAVILACILGFAYAGRHPDHGLFWTHPEAPPAGIVVEKHVTMWMGRNGAEVTYFVSVRKKSGEIAAVQVTGPEYMRLRKGSVIP